MAISLADATGTAIDAYRAVRLAQDAVTVSQDQAVVEALVIATRIKNHGNSFHIL